MSIRIMSEVWDLPHLSPPERLLLLAIADHCNDDGMCYPSAERLQKKCGLSSGTYTKYIKILKGSGLVSKTPRANTRTGRETDIINVKCSNIDTCKLFDNLKALRRKYSRNNLKSLINKNVNNQSVKKGRVNTCKDKPLYPSQGDEYDVEAEAKQIADELDREVG